jgi:ketosteroid isomerase-like protein
MSQENVEVMRTTIEAFGRGEDMWVEAIDEEIEWDNSAYPAVGAPLRGMGRESFIRFLNRYRGTWRAWEVTIKELIDAGDDVVALLHETVRARGSDAPIERHFAQVWTVRDDRAVKCRAYRTKEEALEAAGLRE